MTETDRLAQLRNEPQFQQMPVAMQGWILESPKATSEFLDFFEQGGVFDQREAAGLPSYAPGNPPRIIVDRGAWNAALSPDASAWPQRHMFGTLAHEIGHHKFNTGNVPFTGKTAEEYVQYRSELEANAIFNAFPIFRGLENLPEFKNKPFGSIGYLNEIELGALYGDWKAAKLGDAAVVKQITEKVADAPYTLANPPQDLNRDGRITHGDAYLRDFDKVIDSKTKTQISTDGTRTSFEPDSMLGDKLRGLVGTLDQHANKSWDETSERLWGAALVMGAEKNFSGQDDLHLAFNKPTEQYAAGEILHLFRTGPDLSPDPYAN